MSLFWGLAINVIACFGAHKYKLLGRNKAAALCLCYSVVMAGGYVAGLIDGGWFE